MKENKSRGNAWNRKLPPDEEVLRLAVSGMTQYEIALQFGVSQPSVGKILQRYPEGRSLSARRNPKKKWVGENLQRLVDTYRKLGSVSATARFLSTNRTTVRLALNRAGEPILSQSETQTGPRNPAWRGGVIYDEGRALLSRPDHPHANRGGYVYRSRLVMEESLGRVLLPDEVVHHLNGDVSDDRLENLQLFPSNGEHLRETLKGKTPRWSEEGYARILEGRRKSRRPSDTQIQSKSDAPR